MIHPAKRISSGFTLMETVVAVAIVAILAAILTPIVTKVIDDARATRAASEAQTIADAILNFDKNTGKWPIFLSGASITTTSSIYSILISPGADPGCSVDCASWLPASNRGQLQDILELNAPGYTTSGKFAWRGPYINGVASDPWGNAYVVNASSLAFGLNRAAFVLSAGPNFKIETTYSQNIGSGSSAVTVGGDDIVARIR